MQNASTCDFGTKFANAGGSVSPRVVRVGKLLSFSWRHGYALPHHESEEQEGYFNKKSNSTSKPCDLILVIFVGFLCFLKFLLLESCESGRAGSFYTIMSDSVLCKTGVWQLVSGRVDETFRP